jgi:hypothetical protein
VLLVAAVIAWAVSQGSGSSGPGAPDRDGASGAEVVIDFGGQDVPAAGRRTVALAGASLEVRPGS